MPRRLIEIALDELKSLVGGLASIASEALSLANKCLEACTGTDVERLRSKSRDAYRLRSEALDLATEIIARFQPVAADLRLLQALVSASYDFYRITRYALEIGRTVQILECQNCSFKIAHDAWSLVFQMMELARKAILELDEKAARKLMELDAGVDEAYITGLEELKRSLNVNRCVAAEALILRHLERIADHLTYIASETLYAVKGVREYL